MSVSHNDPPARRRGRKPIDWQPPRLIQVGRVRKLAPLNEPHRRAKRTVVLDEREPTDPDLMGDLSFACPHCGEILFERCNELALWVIGETRCPRCRKWSAGHTTTGIGRSG